MSISSINNMSKHSFEELEKTDTIPSSNYYLNKPPETSQGDGQFFFIQQTPTQMSNPYMAPSIVNTSCGNVGNTFEYDKSQKDIKDENFEEIIESKEIIEDRILRIKHQMIDYTMKQ